jgi:methionyl-tRNA formyltransferase
MNTCVVIDSPRSWFMPFAHQLVKFLEGFGSAKLLCAADEIPDGNEIAFILSYEKKVTAPQLALSRHNIVVHASDLPQGKGMSPLTWQILEGKNVIPICLFEAVEAIDAGQIYCKDSVQFVGNELLGELQAVLGAKIIEMCQRFVHAYPAIIQSGQLQTGPESRYRRRNPKDSRLDPAKTIAEQFNLLRVVDNERYPAFFEWQGRRFILKISPANDLHSHD